MTPDEAPAVDCTRADSTSARSCSIAGCNTPVCAKGLCRRHYQRQWKHGDPEVVLNTRGMPLGDRLLANIDPDHTPDECWPWIGSTADSGYGRLYFEGEVHLAHRLMFLHVHGRWPTPQALHLCDRPSCVNPRHLMEGDHSENMRQKARAGPSPIQQR